MNDGINTGDVVVLKSGGPKMTVARLEPISGVPYAICDWFNGDKTERNSFPIASLKKLD